MEVFKADVAIVGAGGGGLRAAIAVAETDPKLKIALISRSPMRNHTVAAEGGAAAVTRSDDDLEYHFNDTVGGATGCVSRTSSSISSPTRTKNWCRWSTGAARGTAPKTDMSTCALSVA